MLALTVGTAACSAPVAEEAGSASDAVTDVHPTPVKEQVIGNCWLYSVTGLAESLHKAATTEELDLSESYLTYWYWFEQLTKEPTAQCKITEGGTWELARGLVSRYGMMREGDFLAQDESNDASSRQRPALESLNAALADETSTLRTAVARGYARVIRSELNRMWKLAPSVTDDLDAVFGVDGARTLDQASSSVPAGSKVMAANKLPALVPDAQGRLRVGTLADVVQGPAAWNEAHPPMWNGDMSRIARRAFERRVQRALHDGLPVLVSWWVDVDSADRRGNFRRRPSSTPSEDGGGHMSIITDYEVTNVPGYGTLEAGRVERRQAALAAALDDAATVSFFRIKNSWGYWPSTWRETILRAVGGVDLGYNDLHADYLFRPMTVRIDASMLADAPRSSCQASGASDEAGDDRIEGDIFPLLDVILPPGY